MSGELTPGSVVAGFVVQSVIAKGGMGVVYLATQERPRREVALKLIAPERAADPAYRERFLRESELLAGLEHPNIVPIHAAGEWEGQLYLAMRYIRGGTLADRLATSGPLTAAEAVTILAPIADALTVAHEEGIVHRDVKPANILVSGRGHVYLTDFGLTKRTTSNSGLTRVGMAIGTEGYMAPEQFTGEVDPASATRIDIYALGCVLHACLTGTEPYPRDSYEASLFAHVFSPPPSLKDRAPHLAYVDPILARAMAKAPAERYPTANELIADLARAVASAAILAPEPVDVAEPAAGVEEPPTKVAVVERVAEAEPATEIGAASEPVAAEPPVEMEPAPTILERRSRPDPTVVRTVDEVPPPPAGAAQPGATVPAEQTRTYLPLLIVVAIASLLGIAWLASVATGGGNGGTAVLDPTPTVPATTSGPGPTPTAIDPTADLRAILPSGVSDCQPVRGPSDAAAVALQCSASASAGPLAVQYAQFADDATLETAWAEHLAESGYQPGGGDCPATRGEEPWQLTDDPPETVRGRLFCYVSQADESVVEWTFLAERVWAVAWRPGTDLASLDAVVESGVLDVRGSGG